MPGGYVVGQASYGLQFLSLECGAGDLGFCGELRGIEEAAEGDGDLLGEHEAHFAGELMLAGDP